MCVVVVFCARTCMCASACMCVCVREVYQDINGVRSDHKKIHVHIMASVGACTNVTSGGRGLNLRLSILTIKKKQKNFPISKK